MKTNTAAQSRTLIMKLLITGFIFSLCLFFSFGFTISADLPNECVLSGNVQDSSGSSIPDAEVTLISRTDAGQSIHTVTNEEGGFCFQELVSTPMDLVITYPGFEEVWVRGVNGSRSGLAIVLEPARLKESITVTAGTRTEKRLEEVPIRTEIVLPEVIKLSKAKTLGDAVEYNPGIRVENACQNCNFKTIRMLGLQGAYTQILFDGLPSMSSLAKVYGVDHIPAQMVDRIEVVKGGGSAIYGPGAVGGVVNIISHIPSRSGINLYASSEWMSGTPVQSFGTIADWVSESRNSFITAYTQADNSNPMDLNDDAITELADRKMSASGIRFGRNFFEQSAKLSIDFNYMWEDRRGGNKLDLPQDQADITEWVESNRYSFGTSWFHSPSLAWDYRLSFSLADTDRDTYYGSEMDPNAYGVSENPLWLIDGQVNHYLGDHIFSWGSQLRSDGIIDTQPAYSRLTDETYYNFGAYLQDDWFFLDGFELVYGLRVDKHSELEDPVISPRVALMWSPTPDFKFRGSIATGFQAPQVFDEDLHITQVNGEGQIIRNHPDLEEESSLTMTLGLDWRPVIGRGYGLLEINGFDTEIEDLFLVVEDDNPATEEYEFTRINHGKSRVYGVEFNLGYGISNMFQVEGGLVEQRARFADPDPDFNSRDYFSTPNRYGSVSLVYFNRRVGDFFIASRFESGSKLPHYAGFIPEDRLETTPAWGIIDLSFSRDFSLLGGDRSKMNINVGIKNLTNKYQDDLDKTIYRDAGYLWGPRFPRSFFVSLGFDL